MITMEDMYYLDQNNDIQHFGTKGMKWGVRHDKQKQAVKSYREKIPGVTKQSKSAAKTFFKQDRTWNFRTYRKQGSKLAKKEASLTREEIQNGRYAVAKGRNTVRKVISGVGGVALGTTAGLATCGASACATIIGGPVGALAVAGLYGVSGGFYYGRQAKAYGKARAKNAVRVENHEYKKEQKSNK